MIKRLINWFRPAKKDIKDLKAEWLEALESREYEKGEGTLRQDNKFCCLGVLADIIDPDGWKPEGRHRGYMAFGENSLGEGTIGNIPKSTLDSLVSLNDRSDTFAPIIEYIKENL